MVTRKQEHPPRRAVCLDLETTGVSPEHDRIVQVACVELLDGIRLGATACWLVNPGIPIPADASAVHGITDEMVKNSPEFPVIVDDLLAFLSDSPIIAHNAKFDLSFLQESLRRLDRAALRNEVIDTLPLLRRINGVGRASLDAGCRMFGIDLARRKDRHDALIDAELLAELYGFLIGVRKRDLFGLDAMPGQRPSDGRDMSRREGQIARDEVVADRMLGVPAKRNGRVMRSGVCPSDCPQSPWGFFSPDARAIRRPGRLANSRRPRPASRSGTTASSSTLRIASS